jgi:hypothetical protein
MLVLLGCSEPRVSAEIGDDEARGKYVELLLKHKLPYCVDDSGIIHIKTAYEDMADMRREYQLWAKEKYEKEGVEYRVE